MVNLPVLRTFVGANQSIGSDGMRRNSRVIDHERDWTSSTIQASTTLWQHHRSHLHAQRQSPGSSSCKREHPAGAEHGDCNMTKKKSDLTDHKRAVLHAAAYSTNLVAWPVPKKSSN